MYTPLIVVNSCRIYRTLEILIFLLGVITALTAIASGFLDVITVQFLECFSPDPFLTLNHRVRILESVTLESNQTCLELQEGNDIYCHVLHVARS